MANWTGWAEKRDQKQLKGAGCLLTSLLLQRDRCWWQWPVLASDSLSGQKLMQFARNSSGAWRSDCCQVPTPLQLRSRFTIFQCLQPMYKLPSTSGCLNSPATTGFMSWTSSAATGSPSRHQQWCWNALCWTQTCLQNPFSLVLHPGTRHLVHFFSKTWPQTVNHSTHPGDVLWEHRLKPQIHVCLLEECIFFFS